MAGAERHRERTIILVANNDSLYRKRLAGCLDRAGYLVAEAGDVNEATGKISDTQPDLIVLDAMIEDQPELEVLESLRNQAAASTSPLLMLVRPGSRTHELRKCALDTDEFVVKPADPEELLPRVKAMLRVRRQQGEDVSNRDTLTRLYSRSYFDKRLRQEIDRARRYCREVSCVMFDLDRFKSINDAHGHSTGDDILRAFADILLSSTREHDIAARFGGEEIVLLLPETTAEIAAKLGDRLRDALADRAFGTQPDTFSVSASCGVASYPDHARDAATLINIANSALYQAKERGCNQTCVAFSQEDAETAADGSSALKILVVEDNDYNRRIASVVLRASGYEVIEAPDPDEAVNLACVEHPDLVLMEIQLPGISGLEITKRLAMTEATRDIPVVALTIGTVPELLYEVMKAGCRGYITKPIDAKTLASQIETYLQR